MRITIRLDESNATHRAIIRWLDEQSNASAAVRQALAVHVEGQNGVSLLAVNDRLARIERMLAQGVSLEQGADREQGQVDGDGLSYLDGLGL